MALESLGDYRPHELLSRSGRDADLYRAQRGRDSGAVLLKILREPTPTSIAWLRREHEILSALDLPNLLRPVELVHVGERWGIAFEDRGTQPLRVGDAPLPLELFLLVGARAARALAELHAQGLTHLRLAPENLLFDPLSGRLELADLSQASPFDQWLPGHEAWSDSSLPYISPEHTGRVVGNLDARSDLYSLGATLFHLLCGRPPFDARERGALIHAHIARESPDPRTLRPETPEVLAQILARLLRKQPEERYQSSEALALDLERCLASFKARGRLENFRIGAGDRSRRLLIPATLYGREDDLRQLEGLLGQVPGRALALVRGPAGIGKSSLVRRGLRPHLERAGRFAGGKYEQYRSDVLYGALAEAFRGLVRGLLAEPDHKLRQTRQAIQHALGENAAALIEVIPELARLCGPAAALGELGPTETAHRFRESLLAFLRPLAAPERPLVVFLDDLQWAGPSSLELLEVLLDDASLEGLLVIGAYRDEEVLPGSPLAQLLRRREGQARATIDLGPLSINSVRTLLCETLGDGPEELAALAQLLRDRSEGNPFALRELLERYQREGLLRFSSPSAGWNWNPSLGASASANDDWHAILREQLAQLPREVRHLLHAAACIGGAFDLETLALATDQGQAELDAALAPARTARVLRPASSPIAIDSAAGLPALVVPRYEFRHDRVQQAAYSLAPASERSQTHLRLGRLLRKSLSSEQGGRALLEVAAQLNGARDLIDDPAERADLAALDLQAARLARESTSWRDGLRFVEVANELLELQGSERALVFEVRRELALARFLTGDFEGVEAVVAETLPLLSDPLQRASLRNQLVVVRTTQGRYAEAIEVGRAGLKELGVDLPRGARAALEAALERELALQEQLRAGRSFEELAAAPPMRDPSRELAVTILVNLDSASYLSDLDLYALVVVMMVNLSLSGGPVPESAKAYASFGIVLGPLLGRYAEAYRYAELGIAISERFAHKGQECRACHTMANHVLPWLRPIREANAYNARAYAAGYEAGEILWAGYVQLFRLYNRFFEGRTISELLSDSREALAYCRSTRSQIGTDSVVGFQLALEGLRGPVPAHAHAGFVQRCEANGSAMALGLYTCIQAEVELILDAPERARIRSQEAEPLLPNILGVITVAGHTLTDSLLRLRQGLPEAEDVERVRANQATLAAWAESAPENFRPRWLLVEGEELRLRGEVLAAGQRWDEAAQLAQRAGFVQVEALALERQAELWAAAGKAGVAGLYGREAAAAYERWGASAKVKQLRERYPASAASDAPILAGLDLDSFTEASRAISGELDRSRLVPRILQIIVEAAGAEWGFLILDSDAGLRVEAVSSPPAARTAACPAPLEAHAELSQAVVRYTFRCAEELALDDASQGPFSEDPCLRRRRVRSLLALPVVDRGRTRGVLYLTNELVVGAFDQSRRQVVRMLLAQAAVSLANAELVARLERTSDALRADVEARERAERERSLLEDEVRQLQKLEAVGSLAAGIAHDFNNLLAAIFGYTELAMTEVRAPQTRELLEQVLLAGRQARELVGQILSFSRQGNEIVQADFRIVVRDVASLLQSSARPDLRLECSAPETPLTVATRRAELHQIVMNLCTNAIQAMEGKGRLEIRLDRRDLSAPTPLGKVELPPGSYALLRVADEGPGMSPEVLEQIFQAFFTTKQEGQGTGIGLAVVERIVGGLGGVVVAQSAPGVGSVFEVYLPLSAGSSPEAALTAPALAQIGKGERLLFVDDEASITRLAEALLRALGFEVSTSTDSLLALELIREDPQAWDLVISDIRMPGLSGIELARATARLREDLPILLLTGHGTGAELALLAEGTVRGVLAKPFSSVALREAILVALERAPAP